MQIRSLVVACLALGMIGCDERSPVVPVPQSTTSPAAPTLSGPVGVVRDTDGNPVAGAAISFWPPYGRTLFSNAAGEFEIPFIYYENISASKSGYESAVADAGEPGASALTLHNIIRISVGQSARVTVRPNDSYGDYAGSLPPVRYRIRIVRVFATEPVTAQIEVVADDNGPVFYWTPQCGDVCRHVPSPTTLSIAAGSEYVLMIAIPDHSPVGRTFTISTSRAES